MDQVFRHDDEIIKFIWKYLSLKDKLNCRLICRRVNEIISGRNFHPENIYFPSQVEDVPNLTTNHEKLIIRDLRLETLDSEKRQKLDQIRHKLIHLELLNGQFELKALYEFLSEFPMLETLRLDSKLTMKESIDLTNKNLTKLFNFKNFKAEINFDTENHIQDNTKNTLNIEINLNVERFFNINEFDDSNQSTKSLNFIKCIVDRAIDKEIYRLTLHLNSNTRISPMDDTSIVFYKHLNGLGDRYNDQMKKILKFKCIDKLARLPVYYTAEQINILFDGIHTKMEAKLLALEYAKKYEEKEKDMEWQRKREIENEKKKRNKLKRKEAEYKKTSGRK